MSETTPQANDEFTFAPWTLHDGRQIDLIQPAALSRLPDGVILTSVSGRTAIVGRDEIDDETRYGMLAYGLPSRSEDGLTYRAPLPEEYTDPS